MSDQHTLRVIPVDDRAWLVAALEDALAGGAPILPLAADLDPCDPEIEAIRALPRPVGTAVVVRTSGSSGVPKSVALSAEALKVSSEATLEALGGPGQWLVTLPAHLISGLQMLVRSAAARIEPVFAPVSADASEIFEAAREMDADRRYVSLVPVQLSRMLDIAETDEDAAELLTRFDAVLVGGQAVSLELRRRAHALGVSLRRSYGMTETAGGCVYDGVEIGDTYMRIRGGEVQLAGPTLALGYLGDEALTEDRFVVDPGSTPHTRWYRTGDAGEMLGGMLTVTGRLDRVIISGGVNVSLDEIERVARELPGWGSAVALPVQHPEWGERPSLVVEIENGADRASFDEVRDVIRARLGAAAVPEWATETETLPRLAGGKPDHAAIREWIGRVRSSFAQIRDADTATDAATATDADAAAQPQDETQTAPEGDRA